MNKKWIDKFQKLFPDKQIKTDGKRNIIVKNIDNSFVYINPLDTDDLQKLRQEINDDNYTLFDELVSELRELLQNIPIPVIKHLYTIDNLKSSSKDNEILFDKNLTFFTEQEIENHLLLIEYLKIRRAALLCGYPATGKSIAVVDIADRLEKQGYITYYYSFKKKDRWVEVWEEILQNKDNKSVFVIDDIHLETGYAAEVLLKIENFDDLNILFISREVKEVNDTEQRNVYDELKDFTIKTEQPSIDDKAIGIIKKFQNYYQKTNGGNYSVTNYSTIIKKSYRNLVVLREYLKFWESLPEIPLEELDEQQFYRNIYHKYFKTQDIKHSWEAPFLQYLCLYYFEINFYPNPKYLIETDALAENANRIVDNGDGKYAIYHGEYAFLLLKAYKAVNFSKFNRKYKNWEDFFFKRIVCYFQGYIEEHDYPDNLFEILHSISRFKKDVQSGVKDSNLIFKSILENTYMREWILKFCKGENDTKEIALLMFSIIINTPRFIKSFLLAFTTNRHIFKNTWAFSLYTNSFAYIKLHNPEDLDWLEEYYQPHMITIINNSPLNYISRSLNTLNKTDKQKAIVLFSLISNDLLFEKLKTARINEIGRTLNELKNIDQAKTKTLYEGISVDDLKAALKNARINEIGNALNELKNIDIDKTTELYKKLGNTFILKRITEVTLNYKRLLIEISVFPKLDPKLAKELFEQLPDSTLFNWKELNVDSFNILFSTLSSAGYTDEEKQFKQLIEFGWDRRYFFLKNNRLQNIGSFISLMSDYKNGWSAIIKERLYHFEHLVLKESQKKYISDFIATMYQHCPKEAIDIFKIFQKKYPKEQEVTAYAHYYIGKNLIEQDKVKAAYPFLLKAALIFKEIKMNDVYEEINKFLQAMKLE